MLMNRAEMTVLKSAPLRWLQGAMKCGAAAVRWPAPFGIADALEVPVPQ